MNNNTNTEKVIDLVELAKKIWSKRKKVIKWVLIGGIIGFVFGSSKPNQYTANFVIVPEETSSKNSSMSSIAGMMGVNIQNNKDGLTSKLYPKIVASSPFLLEFADIIVKPEKGDSILFCDYILKEQKYPWWNYVLGAPSQLIGWVSSWGSDKKADVPFEDSKGQQASFVGSLSARFKVKPNSEDGTIEILTIMQDPLVAALIADSMYYKLERYINIYKTKKTRLSLQGNMSKLQQARETYYQIDSTYAAASDRNQNLISEKAKIKVVRLENEKTLAFNIYQQMATQVEMDKIKLLEETPIATMLEPVSVPLGKSAPNLKLYIILFGFLGGFIVVAKIVFKEIIN